MKRAFAVLLAAMLVLTACGNTNSQTPAQDLADTPQSNQPETPPVTDEPETPPVTDEPETGADGGGVLVVYYSATGSTEAVAGYIAGALDADTFVITPSEPYSAADLNWRDANSRVNREHDDPALRVMDLEEASVENWADYDTIFIGYPIWWGIAAWPVDSFVSANDFTGKTVIPFCTSSSSDLGESGELLAELAGSGEWLEGHRFRSGASQSEVQAWALALPVQGGASSDTNFS